MAYDHKQALSDLIGQVRAMRERSDEYHKEAERDAEISEAEKHMRVFCVLKELERLGRAFEERANSPESDHVLDQAMALAGAKRCPHCHKWLTTGGGNTGPR